MTIDKKQIELALLYRERNDLEKEIARVKEAHKRREFKHCKKIEWREAIHMIDELYREDIQVVDRELRNHYEYKKQLETVNERIAEIDAQLTSIGSPKIMSPEEAKYQKGTRIYSDINMLELFQEQDQLIKQKQDLLYLISRVQVKLNKLDEEDMQLLEQRYKYKKTLREMAQNMYNGKSTMSRRLDDILLKLI